MKELGEMKLEPRRNCLKKLRGKDENWTRFLDKYFEDYKNFLLKSKGQVNLKLKPRRKGLKIEKEGIQKLNKHSAWFHWKFKKMKMLTLEENSR